MSEFPAGSQTLIVAGNFTNAGGLSASRIAAWKKTGSGPSINQSPSSTSVPAGATATFSVSASGTSSLTYRWRKNGTALSDGSNISGTLTATLNIAAVTAANQGSYDVQVTDTCGTTTSTAAQLTVCSTPTITQQPTDMSLVAGQNASFSVAATGSGTLQYRWRKSGQPLTNGGNINGALTVQLTVSNCSSSDAGYYDVVITDTCTSVTSAAAQLSLCTLPVITQQPADRVVVSGNSTTLSVAASGGTLQYQWRKAGQPLSEVAPYSGTTSPTLSISPVASSELGNYAVRITNSCGAITSASATISFCSGPSITQQPTNRRVPLGGAASLSVIASGTGTLQYRWRKTGQMLTDSPPFSGTTTATLSISPISESELGSYDVQVTDSCATIMSGVANLTLNVVYVRWDANGLQNGSSWTDAYRDVQPAVEAAAGMGQTMEVWVARGTYRPTVRTDSIDPRTATFLLRNRVAVYGGFVGIENVRAQRNADPATNGTVLSGDLTQNDSAATSIREFENDHSRYDNSYHVVSALSTDASASIDGFTIRDAHCGFPPLGGAFYGSSTRSIISNCRLTRNYGIHGSALCFTSSVFGPVARSCTSIDNAATNGAGIYSEDASPLVEDCTSENNYASSVGAGAYNFGRTPIYTHCTFRSNQAASAAGMWNDAAQTIIARCAFIENVATVSGGALWIERGSPQISNSVFVRNVASHGSCIYCIDGSPVIVDHCTIVENRSTTGLGAVEYSAGHLTVRSSVLWGNTATLGPQFYLAQAANLTVAGCNVQGGRSAIVENTSCNPLFCTNTIDWTSNRDVYPDMTPDGHLRAGSPCIDAAADGAGGTDIDGEQRTGTPDIGADEFIDSDNDGLPDWWESKYFGSLTAADANADSDGDGLSNLKEYENYGSHPTQAPYYVDAANGADSNDGRSPTSGVGGSGPKKTLQAGIAAVPAGGTVVVLPGTFSGSGNINLDFSGKSAVLRSLEGSTATYIQAGAANRALGLQSAPALITLDGFSFSGGTADLGGLAKLDITHVQFKNCKLTGSASSTEGGALYADRVSTTFDNLLLTGNTAPIGSAASLLASNVAIRDTVLISEGELRLRASSLEDTGQLVLASSSTLHVSPDPNGSLPSRIRCNVSGSGSIVIEPGATLIFSDNSVVDLGGNNQCNPDPLSSGMEVLGTVIFQDDATLRNALVTVRRLDLTGNNQISVNDIRLPIASAGFGGKLFVADQAIVSCNHITSYGDRYLDMDPDPAPPTRPTITNNHIYVIIDEATAIDIGTILEARSSDADCPTLPCGSGAFLAPAGGMGYTSDPSANWVLDKLELMPAAKVSITNRPGFHYQQGCDPARDPGCTAPREVVYVKDLVLHDNAVLNTGLERLYYQNLVTGPGAQIIDVPLLGFSLSNIAFDDDTPSPANEFDIRVLRRVVDAQDSQPSEQRGDITRLADARGVENGIMELRTRAVNSPQSTRSVAAKGSFARAGDESIIVTFDYLFMTSDANTLINVYVSDSQDIKAASGPDVHHKFLATLRPPIAGPGSQGSGQFATFWGRLPWPSGLKFVRGTYVELELRGANSVVWIDNFDPQVWCESSRCASFDINKDLVDEDDYRALAAEIGQAAGTGKHCLDLTDDGFIDMSDLTAWDSDRTRCEPQGACCGPGSCDQMSRSACEHAGGMFHAGRSCSVNSPCGTGQTSVSAPLAAPMSGTPSTSLLGPDSALYVLGKAVSAASTQDYVYGFPGSISTAVPCSAACGNMETNCVAGTRLVHDAAGERYVIQGFNGILRLRNPTTIVAPTLNVPFGSLSVDVGKVLIFDENCQVDNVIGLPLLDAAFGTDAQGPYVYVMPVVVHATSPSAHTYKAIAKLRLPSFNGVPQIEKLVGMDPLLDPLRNVTCTGGDCKQQVDVQGLRELELTPSGMLLAATGDSYNANSWVVVYDDQGGSISTGYEVKRLSSRIDGGQVPIPPAPSAMHASTSSIPQFANKLYMASAIGSGGSVLVRRFSIIGGGASTGLQFDGEVTLPQPPPVPPYCQSHICSAYQSTAVAIDEDAQGNIYVVSLTRPVFSETESVANQDRSGTLFTSATLAKIPAGTNWAVSPTITGAIVLADSTALALPVSAIIVPRNPADFDGDGQVNAADFDLFKKCATRANVPYVAGLPGCTLTPDDQGKLPADFDRDGDVDLADFAQFQRCYGRTPAGAGC